MNKVLIVLVFLLIHQKAYMSELYIWSTKSTMSIVNEDNKVFLMSKVHDSNGISLVSKHQLELNYQFFGNVEIVWQKNSDIILSDDTSYYSISQIEQGVVVPLMKKSEIKSRIDNIFFYHSGMVQEYLYILDQKAILVEHKNMPLECELLDKNNKGQLLLRTKNKIILYSYTVDCHQVSAIVSPIDIDFKTAVYHKNSLRNDPSFLYDDKRFYLIDNVEHINELTEGIALFNKRGGFLDWVYLSNIAQGEVVFEEKALEALWMYLPLGFYINNEEIYIYALPGKYVSQDKILIEHNNQFFNLCSDLYDYRTSHRDYYEELKAEDAEESEKLEKMKKMEAYLASFYAVDVSVIKNINNLRKFEGFYTDNELVYDICYRNFNGNESKMFEVVKDLSPQAIYHQPILSYSHPTLAFFEDQGAIKFIGQGNKISHTIAHKGELKFLEVAYLFDDKMMIENSVIDSPMDFETAVLKESFVDVINGITDANMDPIDIAYRHYFMDKNGVYLYKTGSKFLEKIN